MKRNLFLFTICITTTILASAQDASQAPAQLTYEEAISIGLKNNVLLNQQKNTLLSRHVAKTAGIAAFTPNIFAQGQYATNTGQQPDPENGDLKDLTISSLGASLNANLIIFNGMSRLNTMIANNDLFRAQTSLVKRAEQDAVFTITNQYLQVLLDQELLKIARENFVVQNTTLTQIRESVSLGARPEADLYNQDAQTKNMELTALRAQVTLETDKMLLAQTLQLDPSVPFEVVLPSDNSTRNFTLSENLDSLIAIAMNSREDLKQFTYNRDANRAFYRAAIGGYMPSLTAFASWGSNYYSNIVNNPLTDDPNGPTYGRLGNQFTRIFPNTTYGVSFNIPIYSRFTVKSNRALARVNYENSNLLRDNLEKTIKLDVKRAYNNYITAAQAMEASEAQLQSGTLALQVQRESYELGVANQVTLATANQTYVQAAASRAQAQVTMVFQKILLEYALGTLKPESYTGN